MQNCATEPQEGKSKAMETKDELGIHLGMHEDSDNRRVGVDNSSMANTASAIFYNSARNQTIQKGRERKKR